MITAAKAEVDQANPTILSEGDLEFVQQGVLGNIWTANWHERLILAGKAYRMNIGTIAAGDAHALVGTGTVIDLDLPEGLVAIDSGFLVPMGLNLGILNDADADNEVVEILLTTDRVTAVPSSDVNESTLETPSNLLDGGPAFQGRAWSIVNTTPISDPAHTDLLYYQNHEVLGTDPLHINDFGVDIVFPFPTLLAGACSLLLYFGGTAISTGWGSLTFAHIPSSWAPIPA